MESDNEDPIFQDGIMPLGIPFHIISSVEEEERMRLENNDLFDGFSDLPEVPDHRDGETGNKIRTYASAKCQICNATFTRENTLKKHIEAVHEGKKPFQCHLCGRAVSRKFALGSHFAKHHPEFDYEKFKFESRDCEKEKKEKKPPKKFVWDGKTFFDCELCDQKFKRKKSLSYHIKSIHDQIKPYKCHLCGYANARRMAVTLHFAKEHERNDDSSNNDAPRFVHFIEEGKHVFRCVVCSSDFEKEDEVKDHMNLHEIPEAYEKGRYIHTQDEDGNFVFKCLVCSEDFTQEKLVKSHISDVHGKALFKCHFENCDYANARRNHLNNHIQSVHEGKKPFQCHICNNSFTLRSSLSKHIKSVHEKLKPYKCKDCDNSFAQSAHLKAHVTAIHLGIKPFKCTICDASFGSFNAHDYHVRSVHHKIKPFECEHCGEKYSGKQNLRLHIAIKHEGLKGFECSHCGKTFTRPGPLNHHIRSVHQGEKTYKCKDCGESFLTKHYLVKHRFEQHGDRRPNPKQGKNSNKIFKCSECNIELSSKRNLLSHVTSVHEGKKGGEFKCSLCNAELSSKRNLDNHMISVHEGGNNRINDFRNSGITIKDEPFDESEEFEKLPLLIKTEPEDQDMETKDLSGVVVHEGEKFYQCGSCDQKFTSKYNMQRHVKNVHGQKKSKHKKGEKSVTIEEYDFCDKNENTGGGGGNGEPSLKIKIKKEPQIYDDNTIVYDENSELTHKCSLCDKAFLHKYNIKRHMKLVHDGVKPFDCEYCGKSFGTKEILNRHIKKVHENDNKNCKRKKKKVKIKMKKQDFADSQISIENCDSNIHDAILGSYSNGNDIPENFHQELLEPNINIKEEPWDENDENDTDVFLPGPIKNEPSDEMFYNEYDDPLAS